MSQQTCDFCGAAVAWGPEQVELDLHLKLHGLGGLGVLCSACKDRIVAIEEERRLQEQERLEDEDDG